MAVADQIRIARTMDREGNGVVSDLVVPTGWHSESERGTEAIEAR